ncbi:phosphatidylinositol mannoside acyltransferase [Streptoalloteichus tenebrarius]|uniref:phosphatidylinositol mannoside acyltransferase n=1 Tax=Streptoalloteichus tenebrarius (strain ATCC 17920 / DSM 40477 / JCM 4838 / CBS 697.72 / NBRC 16177 / NCIMB 11028 / NRRL B-12390 / A12253. 1 / ISP 5477) TaxID=1933 RepID=UPI0020A58A05|nr:phosphatidylinositol mannoside acyltransferase [Streptoalloteichus tenebrarius]
MRASLVDAGYAAGWRLVRTLPEPVARALFRAGADLGARRAGAAVGQLRRNLARVVPTASPAELDDLVRRALRSYARYWCEAFRLPSTDHRALHRRLDPSLRGSEHLDAALEAGRGAIVVLPHSGNWDAAGVWLVGHSGTFTTVVERLRPESLYRRFLAYRESLGFEILPTTGGPVPPVAVLARRLRRNGVVCLVADRDLSSTGVDVTFFGERARMPAGPAHLAARTGAALLPVRCLFAGERDYDIAIHPPVPVPGREAVAEATQAVADVFAADIASRPEDWHMTQRLWLADLPGDRAGRPRAEGVGTVP